MQHNLPTVLLRCAPHFTSSSTLNVPQSTCLKGDLFWASLCMRALKSKLWVCLDGHPCTDARLGCEWEATHPARRVLGTNTDECVEKRGGDTMVSGVLVHAWLLSFSLLRDWTGFYLIKKRATVFLQIWTSIWWEDNSKTATEPPTDTFTVSFNVTFFTDSPSRGVPWRGEERAFEQEGECRGCMCVWAPCVSP